MTEEIKIKAELFDLIERTVKNQFFADPRDFQQYVLGVVGAKKTILNEVYKLQQKAINDAVKGLDECVYNLSKHEQVWKGDYND